MTRFLGTVGAPHEPARFVPEACAASGCRIALRGFVANRDELAARLRGGADRAGALSEAELIALAYRRWGPAFQSHVLGEYAYALFDDARRELVLGHDALGILPLFYRESAGGFAFASHLDDLVRAHGAGPVDEEYVADYLSLANVAGDRTPFAGVRRVPPGRALVLRGGALRGFTTHDPAAVERVRLNGPAAYEERFRALAADAVRGALPATGTVWSELSGGLDSSTVLSLAAGLAPGRVEALSVVYGTAPRSDESDWIAVVLADYDVPWHRVDAGAAPPFSDLPDAFHAEPNHALLLGAFYRRRDALIAAGGPEVVLTGQGGDAVLCGDGPEPYHLADAFGRGPVALARAVGAWTRAAPQRRAPAYWFETYALRPALRRLAGRRVTRIPAALPAWVRPGYASSMGLRERRERPQLRGLSFEQEWFWERVRHSSRLVTVDLCQRPAAYATRSPLLYLPLVEFMAGVPASEKFLPGEDRHLQRRALRGVLPERTRLRRGKRGADQVFYDALRDSDAWVELLTARPELVERGYLDGAAWREAVLHARFGHGVSAYFLSACALEAWFRTLRFAGSAASDPAPASAAVR